jgi:NAD(P)-dependent dehydrogenase (short-subunit alcohol dehydrogenase family)
MGQLDDRVALVTGGASGIGAATVARFRTEGATAISVDVVGGPDVVLDVTDEDAVARAVRDIVDTHGRLDVVVNAAGVAGGGPVHLVDGTEWDRVMDVNLKGTFHVCKHAGAQMVAQRSGSIVNIASIEGIEGTEGGSAYNASKGGVIMLTKSMAIDYGPCGIRVNAVCPGGVETPLLLSLIDQPGMQDYKAKMLDAHKLGRFGRPEEIANAILFLASSEASFMTGSAMVVDGGMTAGLSVGLFGDFS